MKDELTVQLEDGDRRIEIHETIAEQVKWLNAFDEAAGFDPAPDVQALIERVMHYDRRLGMDLDEAIGAIMAQYGMAGYIVGWRAHADLVRAHSHR